MAYYPAILTIIESPLFTKLWPDYWSDEEHTKFTALLAENPEAGEVVQGSGGCRKIRWSRYGSGKRAKENIPAHILKQIAEEMGNVP